MAHLTDQALAALFARHVGPGDPPPGFGFVGSKYYRFARELEHRAMVAGMSIRLAEQAAAEAAQAAPAPPPKPTRRATVSAWAWAGLGWFGRHSSGG